VVVTAARAPQTPEQLISDLVVIDAEQIARAGPIGLAELLQRHAGAELSTNGGPGQVSGVFLRGTNTSHVVLLIDGVRVNSATTGTNALEHVPLAQIERIEVLRGPASSLYGADAIGGVIQIFTRRDHGAFAPHFQLGAGSNGLREASGGFGGSIGRGWFGGDAGYQRTDGINACRGSATLFQGCYADEPDRDGYRNHSLNLRGGYTFSDALSMEASALRTEGENEYDGFYNYSEIMQQVFSGKLRYTPGERVAVTVNAGRSDNESDNYTGDVHASTNNTHRDTASVQADVTVAGGQLLSAGVDWYQDHLDSSTAYLVDSRENTAVFVQYQGTFGAQQWQAGVRNDDNDQFGNHTTGSLGWGMTLDNGFRLSANYGTGFKAPTFSDLYDPWSGVPGLKPEESESLNLGLAQTAANWNWALDVYETRIDDLITYDSTTWMMSQVERARIRGAEFTFNTTLAGWDLSTQLSHTDPRNHSAGVQHGNLLARRARNTARVDLDRRFGDFRFGTTLIAAGERFDDAANNVRLGGYGTLDLRVEYALSPAWSLQARATNVLDRDYETVAWYNQPGREYGLRLKYRPAH
ncbi:MAG TPA: TonB-dependent receptor, partial [Lysobacter sp.]|nr:TonB-dependent receptor [Lysobacter sp.]